MAPKHDTVQGHHNPSNPQSTTSIDCKLATGKDESFSNEAVKNGDTINIMDELTTMKRPLNPLESSIPESTLQRISKKITKEAVEDKKVELKQSGMKIPAIDVDVLRLIDTLDFYGLINNGINKYNEGDTMQGFINDMIDNRRAPTVVKGNNKVTVAIKLRKTKPIVVHENKYGNTKLSTTGLKSNNNIGAHIVEENEVWFYGWADKYDVGDDHSYTPTKENESGSSHTFTGENIIFKLTKTIHNGRSKTRLVSVLPTSVELDFYIGERQS